MCITQLRPSCKSEPHRLVKDASPLLWRLSCTTLCCLGQMHDAPSRVWHCITVDFLHSLLVRQCSLSVEKCCNQHGKSEGWSCRRLDLSKRKHPSLQVYMEFPLTFEHYFKQLATPPQPVALSYAPSVRSFKVVAECPLIGEWSCRMPLDTSTWIHIVGKAWLQLLATPSGLAVSMSPLEAGASH